MTEKHQILVVEDDPLVSEVIAVALDDTYPVTVVATAAAAKTLLQQGHYRLMLLDCTLPGGIDLELLPRADLTGTAVILMSGDPGRIAKLTNQPRPFVLKPFSLTGLLDTVEIGTCLIGCAIAHDQTRRSPQAHAANTDAGKHRYQASGINQRHELERPTHKKCRHAGTFVPNVIHFGARISLW